MERRDTHLLQKAHALFKKTIYTSKIPVKTVRKNFEVLLGTAILPNNIDRKEIDLISISADLLIPEMAIGKKTILYLHGGGFVSGSRLAYRNLCASLAHEGACKLLLPEYRLAPEYPFPTALEDAYNSYSWLLQQNIPSGDIIFAGDGSGANLALSLIHFLLEKKAPQPQAILCISPWVDLHNNTPSITKKKTTDPIMSREALISQALHYTSPDNYKNPNVSPIYGDFSFFPPLYIQCGTEEILLDDAKLLAQAVQKAGSQVTIDIQEGMWHLFQAIDTLTPQAHLAVKKMGSWIRRENT